jgi:hypothetical protein
VTDDDRIPPISSIVERLLKNGSNETEDVMALVGFVGPGRDGDVRLYPDIDFQRWMDIAPDDIVGSSPLTAFNPGRLDRTVVWVRRDAMMGPVFKPDSLKNFEDDFAGSWMSTWPLIPETRLVAAQILDLVPHLEYGDGGEGR